MTEQDILTKVASGEIKPGEAATLLAALKGNGNGNGKITYKVSKKGALSAYGMGRWPVTLYRGQWEKLDSDEERQRRAEFINANSDKLTSKS